MMPVMAAWTRRQCALALDNKAALTALRESLVSRDLEIEFEHGRSDRRSPVRIPFGAWPTESVQGWWSDTRSRSCSSGLPTNRRPSLAAGPRWRRRWGRFAAASSTAYSTARGVSTGSVSSGATMMNQRYWGWKRATLPGGRYVQLRLQGEPPAVYELIAPTFERLAHRADRDPSRPDIEFYRRRDVIDLLLPVK